MSTLLVPSRFNGPPRSGNGGWVAGALAATLAGNGVGRPVTVTLRLPPPLETPLEVAATEEGALLTHDGRTVAEGTASRTTPAPVAPVAVAEAAEAEASYAGRRHHPFPRCFVCGTEREPGDGLRIHPGAVSAGRVAATWVPTEVDVPVAWAAADCTGAWASDLEARPLVLGRMTVLVERLPEVGEDHVVVGEVRGVEGRKTFTAATVYGPGEEVVVAAEHTWIAIDPEEFG